MLFEFHAGSPWPPGDPKGCTATGKVTNTLAADDFAVLVQHVILRDPLAR